MGYHLAHNGMLRQSSASEDCQSLARTRPSAVLMLEAGVVASPISAGSGNQHCRINVACVEGRGTGQGQVIYYMWLYVYIKPNNLYSSSMFQLIGSRHKTALLCCEFEGVWQILFSNNSSPQSRKPSPSIKHWEITQWVWLKITRPTKSNALDFIVIVPNQIANCHSSYYLEYFQTGCTHDSWMNFPHCWWSNPALCR